MRRVLVLVAACASVGCRDAAIAEDPPEPPAIHETSAVPVAPVAPATCELSLAQGGIGCIPVGAKVTSDSLRQTFPKHRVWTSERFFENAPDHAVPVLCVGDKRDCYIELYVDERGRIDRATTTRREVRGPDGIRVGDLYAAIKRQLAGCRVGLGVRSGVFCTVSTAPNVRVSLSSEVLLHEPAHSEEPTAAQLAEARVVDLEWTTRSP